MIDNRLTTYIADINPPQKFDDLTFSDEFINLAILIAKSRPYLWIKRKVLIEKLFLAAKPQIGQAKVFFRAIFRPKASAKDNGTVTLSLPFVNKSEGAKLLKTVLHETGHVYASKQGNYPDTLRLAKLYKLQFKKDLITLEPTEYAATSFSIAAMKVVAESADDIVAKAICEQIDEETKKLTDALDKLKAMAF